MCGSLRLAPIKYNKLRQSYPQINTDRHTKTPFGSVDRPDGLVHQQHQTGWEAGPVFEQLGTDHTRPMGLAGHIRVPNRAKPDPMASKPHARDKMLPGGAREYLTGDSRTYGQGCYSGDNTVQKQFCVPNLSVEKKEGGQRPVINLKSLNTFVRTEHFKMEGLHILPDQAQDWMIKMDLKDAYLQVPIHREHQQLLQFQWNGKIFQFQCLSFGLTSAPRVFSKVMKPVVGTLRHMGIRLIIYLDDILILHQVKELIQITTLTL